MLNPARHSISTRYLRELRLRRTLRAWEVVLFVGIIPPFADVDAIARRMIDMISECFYVGRSWFFMNDTMSFAIKRKKDNRGGTHYIYPSPISILALVMISCSPCTLTLK